MTRFENEDWIIASRFAFSRNGILAEGIPNQEMMVIGELNMTTILDTRTRGAVLLLLNSRRSAECASKVEGVSL